MLLSILIAGNTRIANIAISLLNMYGAISSILAPPITLLITTPIFSNTVFILSKSLSPISTILFETTWSIAENSLSSTNGLIFPFSSKIKIGI